jgi:hypothetical protein
VKKVKRVEVYLHNLATDDMTKIGDADDYDKALTLAKNSGLVPKGWNVAVTDANDERIIVACKKGVIMSGIGSVSPVRPPKPKPKKVPVLPEKLVGPNPDVAFAPRSPAPDVPGVLNMAYEPRVFKYTHVRPVDPAMGTYRIRCEILKGPTKELDVRKDILATELLALALKITNGTKLC